MPLAYSLHGRNSRPNEWSRSPAWAQPPTRHGTQRTCRRLLPRPNGSTDVARLGAATKMFLPSSHSRGARSPAQDRSSIAAPVARRSHRAIRDAGDHRGREIGAPARAVSPLRGVGEREVRRPAVIGALLQRRRPSNLPGAICAPKLHATRALAAGGMPNSAAYFTASLAEATAIRRRGFPRRRQHCPATSIRETN